MNTQKLSSDADLTMNNDNLANPAAYDKNLNGKRSVVHDAHDEIKPAPMSGWSQGFSKFA